MTGPVNALHGDEGRDTNFHTAAGSDLGKRAGGSAYSFRNSTVAGV